MIQSRPVFLEKGTAAGGEFQRTQQTALKIIVIRKIRGCPGVGTPAGQAGEGLEKDGVHGLVFKCQRH